MVDVQDFKIDDALDLQSIIEGLVVESVKFKKNVLLTERIDILIRSIFRILKRFFEILKENIQNYLERLEK